MRYRSAAAYASATTGEAGNRVERGFRGEFRHRVLVASRHHGRFVPCSGSGAESAPTRRAGVRVARRKPISGAQRPRPQIGISFAPVRDLRGAAPLELQQKTVQRPKTIRSILNKVVIVLISRPAVRMAIRAATTNAHGSSGRPPSTPMTRTCCPSTGTRYIHGA